MNSTQLDFILVYAVIGLCCDCDCLKISARSTQSILTLVHLLPSVQLYGVHGPLSKRAPGKAFLAENIQASSA
jgi:hypothetical protein